MAAGGLDSSQTAVHGSQGADGGGRRQDDARGGDEEDPAGRGEVGRKRKGSSEIRQLGLWAFETTKVHIRSVVIIVTVLFF